MKTMMLAALTVLSLGIGTAFAQGFAGARPHQYGQATSYGHYSETAR